jgi:hypothetical protein
VNYSTGEQTRNMNKARQARCWNDTHTVFNYLHLLLSSDPSLPGISTGVYAHTTVNIDMAVETTILDDKEGYIIRLFIQDKTTGCHIRR